MDDGCLSVLGVSEKAGDELGVWRETGDPARLAAAVDLYGELYHAGAGAAAVRFAACGLGDAYTLNGTYSPAYHLLNQCVFGVEPPKNLKDAVVSSKPLSVTGHSAPLCPVGATLDDFFGGASGTTDANGGSGGSGGGDRALWEAQGAGQLGRLLMRFGQPRDALEALGVAREALARDGGDPGARGGATDRDLSLAAVEGFTGLVKRTRKDHAGAEPHLRRALLLAEHLNRGGGGGSGGSGGSGRVGWRPTQWWNRADVREVFINHGDALARTGRAGEARATFRRGAAGGLFAHEDQRPVHEVRKARREVGVAGAGVAGSGVGVVGGGVADGGATQLLAARPVWRSQGDTRSNTDGDGFAVEVVEAVARALEAGFDEVRAEAVALLGEGALSGGEAADMAAGEGAGRGGGSGGGGGGVLASALAVADHVTGGRLGDLGLLRTATAGPSAAASPVTASSVTATRRGFSPANDMLLEPGTGALSRAWFAARLGPLALPSPWSQFFLFEHGLKDLANCARAPKACALAEALGAANCTLGDAKLSLMAPGTQVRASLRKVTSSEVTCWVVGNHILPHLCDIHRAFLSSPVLQAHMATPVAVSQPPPTRHR